MRKIFFLLALTTVFATACKEKDDPMDDLHEPITLDCATINSDMVLVNDPDAAVDYIIPCTIEIDADVIIEPGTVIHFASDAGFSINSGSLKSAGTAAAPIILEGSSKVKGSWRGLIYFSNNVNNILEYTTIRYAGGNAFNSNNDRGSVIVYANGKLDMRNTTLTQGAEYGLQINYTSASLTFSNNTINDHNKAPVLLPANLAHKLDAASTFTGNARQYLEIGTAEISEQVTWVDAQLPYRIVDNNVSGNVEVSNNGQLTLSAGLQMDFEADLGLEIASDGAIKAIGTSSNPILLSGASSAAGAWRGMIVYSDDLDNQFEHVQMTYAGSSAFNSNGDVGTIILWANSRFSILNSTLKDGSGTCGIVASYNNTSLTESGNTYLNVGTPICL